MQSYIVKAITNSSLRRHATNDISKVNFKSLRIKASKHDQCLAQFRAFGSRSRGARGHGWLHHYRAGNGGRHLQGRYHYRDVNELSSINDSIFELGTTDCFLEIELDGKNEAQRKSSRVVFELASTALPRTCENFIKLCEDEYYNDTKVFKIQKNVGICMGDTMGLDGKGGKCHPDISPYGYFEFEEKVVSHTQKGILTMLAPGVDRNDSRFCITLDDSPQLDGRYVAFGRIKDLDSDECGMKELEDIILNVFTKKGTPQKDILIKSCGTL